MAGIEKNCKWNFAECLPGMMEEGPNNALWEHFRGQSKFTTLVRESIQNSLDAVYDETKPVSMHFSFENIDLPNERMPQFMEINNYIKGCMTYWKNNSDAKRVCQPMRDYISDHRYRLPYLRVADYNTKGMEYRKGDNNCSFFGFLRGQGTSVKGNSNAGGSFGFGKMAYFGFSEIYTIIISSMTQRQEVVFEGASMLCTNMTDGVKRVSTGYYDDNNGLPVTNRLNIPEPFRRSEPGTDINIMGIKDSKEDIKACMVEIVQCVLQNFWMAVYKGKLEVVIGINKINKTTLPKFMEAAFPEVSDRDSTYANPRPYYEAVKGVDERSAVCKLFKDRLPNLGKVQFYIMRNNYTRDRFLAMRKPLMIIKDFRMNSNYGFSGVFICADEKGNELLRMTEPPAHDNWMKSRVNDKSDPKQKQARLALQEVRQFTQQCVHEFFYESQSDEADFLGAEDYLYSVNPDDVEAGMSGLIMEPENGKPTGDIADRPTSSPTTSINPEIPKYDIDYQQQEKTGQVTIKQPTAAKKDDGGDLLSGNGDKPRKQKGGGAVGSPKAEQRNTAVDDGNEGSYQLPFAIKYRCFATQQKSEGGNTVYKLKFQSPHATDSGIINVYVAGAESEEELPLEWSSKGNTLGNAITDLNIHEGQNELRFSFHDNMKHAIYLQAYEKK